MKSNIAYWDIEANGLLKTVDKLWCISIIDANRVYTADHRQQGFLEYLDQFSTLVGHNIIAYDLPVLKKLYGWVPRENVEIIDTLIMSRVLFPGLRDSHGLASWGKTLKFPKGEIKDFSYFQPEMLPYCINDVKLTQKVHGACLKEIERLNIPNLKTAIKEKMEFAKIMALQVEAGLSLDVEKAKELAKKMQEEYETYHKELVAVMPALKADDHYKKIKEEGRLVSSDNDKYSYTQGKNNKLYTKEFKYKEPNPNSRKQLTQWLISKGWRPTIKTEKGDWKLDEKTLKTIDIPEAKNLVRMFELQKKLGMLSEGDNAWLKLVGEDGKVHGEINVNAAITGRCTHSNPNLGQCDSEMREVWIAKKGWKLVDCDAKSLEVRILAHYLHPYDKGAYTSLVLSGQDIHDFNREMMELHDRHNAKTINYAMAYGAGNWKLGVSVAKDRGIKTQDAEELKRLGKQVRDNVMANFTGYEQLLKVISYKLKERGYLISLAGRPLYPSKDYSALNAIIQGAGADIMEKAVLNFYETTKQLCGRNYNFVNNIHDEVLLEADPEYVELLKEELCKAIRKTTEQFKLNCEMDGEAKTGDNWKMVH